MEYITQQTRRALPLEVVERIVQSIDARDLAPTLFPLLTVNKAVFSLAVRRLYVDLYQSLASCRYPALAIRRLLGLISNICPEVDQVLLQHAIVAISPFLPPHAVTSTTAGSLRSSRDGAGGAGAGGGRRQSGGHCSREPFADYFSWVRVLDLGPDLEEAIKMAARAEQERRRQRRLEQALAATAALENGLLEGGGGEQDEDMEDITQVLVFKPENLEPVLWMACGDSHLGKLRQVSIRTVQIAAYEGLMAAMTGVETIVCHFDLPRWRNGWSEWSEWNMETVLSSLKREMAQVQQMLERLREARRYHMKQKQQQRQKTSGQPGALVDHRTQCRPVNIQLYAPGNKDIWYNEGLEQPLRQLLTAVNEDDNGGSCSSVVRVEGIYHGDLSTACDPNWVRFYVAPESIDLASVELIRQYSTGYMQDNVLPWPQAGKAAILQQCRNLRHLEVYVGDGEDASLFAWAKEERQQALSGSNTLGATKTLGAGPLGRATSPGLSLGGFGRRTVPLETLHLGAPWGATMARSLENALYGFGATLQRLRLDAGGMEMDLAVFQNLGELRELEVETGVIECSLDKATAVFRGCPRLESVVLQEDGDGETREMMPRWAAASLKRLKRISLMGHVAYRLDQATLTELGGQLEELTLFSEVMMQSPAETAYTWDREAWRGLNKLERLQLRGAMATAFRTSMLAECPALRQLDLAGPMSFYAASELEDLSRCLDHVGTERKKAQEDCRWASKVRKLSLSGWWLSTMVMEQELPALFPALEQLEIRECSPSTNVSQKQREAMRARFPELLELIWR